MFSGGGRLFAGESRRVLVGAQHFSGERGQGARQQWPFRRRLRTENLTPGYDVWVRPPRGETLRSRAFTHRQPLRRTLTTGWSPPGRGCPMSVEKSDQGMASSARGRGHDAPMRRRGAA
jgi:hypothetical protein